MKNVYDYINILGNKEEKIKSSINMVRDTLSKIDESGNCYSFSNHIYNELISNHVVCKVINTKDLGFDYMHYFVLVPDKESEYYLIDLTYSQFNNDNFKDLLTNGYMKVNYYEFILYLSIVGGKAMDVDIDDAYFNSVKTNKKI